jgi:hypothetical protein
LLCCAPTHARHEIVTIIMAAPMANFALIFTDFSLR